MWVFLFTGDFRKFDRREPGGKLPIGHTLYTIVDPNEPAPFQIAAPPIALSLIGTAKKLASGENANIDAVRVQVGAGATLQLDLDPNTPGVQPSLAVSGAQDISIDVVLDGNVGNVSAFNFTLVYDDTLLTPAGENGGGLKGNPGFNDAALGTAWDCSGGASPSPDIDPAKGAGHGAALLSCYALAGGTSPTTPAVIATLRLRAAAPGSASIALAGVSFAHGDGTEIGSCNPAVTVEMTCAGGALVAQ
jgi:hypothetical protein